MFRTIALVVFAATFLFCAASHHVPRSLAPSTEAFFLSVNAPLIPAQALGIWPEIEKLATDASDKGDNIYVITAPVFPGAATSRQLSVQTIGMDDLRVPTHYFRVHNSRDEQGGVHAEGYVVPNTPNVQGTVAEFRKSVMEIEAMTGQKLLPEINTPGR